MWSVCLHASNTVTCIPGARKLFFLIPPHLSMSLNTHIYIFNLRKTVVCTGRPRIGPVYDQRCVFKSNGSKQEWTKKNLKDCTFGEFLFASSAFVKNPTTKRKGENMPLMQNRKTVCKSPRTRS